MRDPPLRSEIRAVSRIEEAVIPGIWQEGLQRKEKDRPDGGQEGQNEENKANAVSSALSEVYLRELS